MRQPALVERLLALADDELILAHRDSEWTGHAPILEEDIAFANIALDEMGHASLWYALVEPLADQETDSLIFFRPAATYRCAQLVELPKGDWAFSMLRQYLFDAAEAARLPGLARSGYKPLAQAAAKVRTEEVYHLRHTSAWLRRLGHSTGESHERLQAALDLAWPYVGQLFRPLPSEAELVAEGLVPDPAEVQTAWLATVQPALQGAGLTVAPDIPAATADRTTHTQHLLALLGEMQQVARLEKPGADW